MPEILIGVGVGLLLILVAFISGVLLLMKVARSGNRPAQQPAATPAQPRTFKETVIPYTPWLVGIGLIVGCALVYHFYESMKIETVVLWLSGLLFAGIALQGTKHSSGGSIWFTRLAGVGVVVVMLAGLLFGDKAPEVGAKIRKDVTEMALRENKSTTADSSLNSNALPAAVTKVVTWSEYKEDGSIPVGVRSEEFKVHDKCTLNNYPMGYGHIYVLWYFDEKSSEGWTVQKYDTGIVGANRKFAVEVLVPRVKKEEMKFLEVCPYTLPKE